MRQLCVSRRHFLWISGGAAVAFFSASSTQAQAGDETPPLLDHILLGCADLREGIEFVASAIGVRAAFGGVHPGRGTQNALLSLGERRYLEIIAPDPQQEVPDELRLRTLQKPQLVGWAAHRGDLVAFAQKCKAAGLEWQGPRAGSRTRPDGRVLNWKTLTLADDRQHLLPFFIECSANTVHPSVDAPGGCKLEQFVAETPDPEALGKIAAQLELQLPIEKGPRPRLTALLSGPKGKLAVTS